jgi:hypothetical protein
MSIDCGLLAYNKLTDSEFFCARKRGVEPPSDGAKILPLDFLPGNWDVICQRGRMCHDHGKSMTGSATVIRFVLHSLTYFL